jgi:hypothetical protein
MRDYNKYIVVVFPQSYPTIFIKAMFIIKYRERKWVKKYGCSPLKTDFVFGKVVFCLTGIPFKIIIQYLPPKLLSFMPQTGTLKILVLIVSWASIAVKPLLLFCGTFARGRSRAGIGPNLHQRVALNALPKGKTINKYITEVLDKAIQEG